VTKEAINSPDFVRVSRSCYAVFRHFDVGDSAKREKQLDQIYRGIFGSLAHDVADRGGYGRVEQDASGLQSGKIHAYRLAWLKGSHNSPLIKLWACSPPIANQLGRFAEFLEAPASCLSRCKRDRQFFSPLKVEKASGTPALLNPVQLRAGPFQKLSYLHKLVCIVYLHNARYYASARPSWLFAPRRRGPWTL